MQAANSAMRFSLLNYRDASRQQTFLPKEAPSQILTLHLGTDTLKERPNQALLLPFFPHSFMWMCSCREKYADVNGSGIMGVLNFPVCMADLIGLADDERSCLHWFFYIQKVILDMVLKINVTDDSSCQCQ
ncbi:hypothetical protein CDAR_472941 [Caerostris darwini]|uniref:Uncharacterized protein n=1 Tax=Caerostris darwini TaxID=1538125 RepID=A0AAV4VAR2_9ARAC|nr:hypothetical protein CDAR_472941 [Caerostris darwini]